VTHRQLIVAKSLRGRLRTGKFCEVSSVLERLGPALPGAKIRNTGLLVAGMVILGYTALLSSAPGAVASEPAPAADEDPARSRVMGSGGPNRRWP